MEKGGGGERSPAFKGLQLMANCLRIKEKQA
jgi:hypothetical protein